MKNIQHLHKLTGIKQLQKDIRAHGGYILSDGTLNLQHLMPKAHDLIMDYNLRDPHKIKQQIVDCFKIEGTTFQKGDRLWNCQYYGYAELKDETDDDRDTSSWVWNEAVFNYFNNIAPRGYYFGGNEGDGACLGWFKYEEDPA